MANKPTRQMPAPADWPTAPPKPDGSNRGGFGDKGGKSERGGFGGSKRSPFDPNLDEEFFVHARGGPVKRYDGGGKVSDSQDTGTANARADAKSIDKGERDFGKNNSNIRNRVGTRSGEPTVSPLIRVYNQGGPVKHGSSTQVGCRGK
jgi:hypothetical protein